MSDKPQKTCFVTIGATASFSSLIEAVLSISFCAALESHDYTDLLVQYGQDGKDLFEQYRQTVSSDRHTSLKINGFDLDMAGLGRYMRQAKGVGVSTRGVAEGVVISHAGIVTVASTLFYRSS